MISKTIGFRGLAYFQTHPNYEAVGTWDCGNGTVDPPLRYGRSGGDSMGSWEIRRPSEKP